MYHIQRTGKYILLIIVLFTYLPAQGKHLFTVRDVRDLSAKEAEKHYDVIIEGVITYSFPEQDYGFIQDNTAGIFLFFNEGDKPKNGDFVRVKGKAYPGDFAPIINETHIQILGEGSKPATPKNIEESIFNGHEDSQWIGVEGIIKSVKFDNYHQAVKMKLDMRGRIIQIYLQQAKEEKLPFHLLGCTVFVEGVCASDFNQKKQLLGIRMMVNSQNDIKILKNEKVDPFKKSPINITQLMQFSSEFDIDQRIKIRGTIIHPGVNQKLYIEDSTASIIVRTNKEYDFKIGDVIDVVGFVVFGELAPEIEEGLCVKIGENEAEPVFVDSFESLLNIPEASLVSLDATLLKVINQSTFTELYLEKDNLFFQARLEESDSLIAQQYESGSVLNLTGVSKLYVNPLNIRLTDNGIKIPDGINIILRKKDDIKLVTPPPWFSLQKALGLLAGLGILILMSFIWVYFLKRKVTERTRELNKSNQDLLNAQKEKDAILFNVEEGFFLLDDRLQIQSQFSQALLKIMESDSPAGKMFIDYISVNLQKKNIELINNFLELLIDDSIDEDVLKDLNPINKLEFKFLDKEEISYSKYLTFEFKRIHKNDAIIGVIVTVIEETEEFMLSQKLKETEEKSKKQVEWLMSIIQLDSKMLNEFMKSTNDEVKYIEGLLKNDDPSRYIEILEQISRSLHLLKGNANLLDLKFFAHQVHHLEDIAISIRSKQGINGDAFLPIVFGIEDLKENINDLKSLIGKLSSMNFQQLKKEGQKEHALIKSLKSMVMKMSEEQDKKVDIDTNEFDINIVPSQYILLLKNVLVQLARNSLAHGIESIHERKEVKKPETGTIKLHTSIEDNFFILKYSDDGRGLQLETLKEKAVKMEKVKPGDVDGLNKGQLANVIFENGVSSKDNADLFAGRGIGMDLIKSQIDKYKGIINVDFEENKFCEFTISLPLSA